MEQAAAAMAAMPTPSRDVRSSLDLAGGARERRREVGASLDEAGLRRAGEGLEALRAELGQPDGRDLDPVEGDDEWQRAIAASLAEHHGRRPQVPRPDQGSPPRPRALDQRGMAVGHRQGAAQSREGTEDGVGGERGARRRERQGRGREGRGANGAVNAGVDGSAANWRASAGDGAGMDFDLERAIAESMREAQGEPRERGEGRLERERARVREGRERERRDANSNRAARQNEQSVGAVGGIGVSQSMVQGPGGQAAAGQARGGARVGQATPRQIVDDFGEVVDVQAVGEARAGGAAGGSQAVGPREEDIDRRRVHAGAREAQHQHQLAGASEGRAQGQRDGQAGQRGERVQQVLEQVIRDSAPRPAIQSNAEAAAMRYFSMCASESASASMPVCQPVCVCCLCPSIFDVCTNVPGRQLRRRQRQGQRQRPLHVRRRRQQLKRKLLVLPLPPTPMPALPATDTEHMCPVPLPKKARVAGRAGQEPPRVIQGLRDTGRQGPRLKQRP